MGEFINDAMPFTVAQARSLGLDRSSLRTALETHRVRRVLHGVYIDAMVPDSRRARLESVRRVMPVRAVACNETAAWLFGVDTFKPSEQFTLIPSFLVPHGTSRIRSRGVRCRQAIVDAADVTVIDDVSLTNPLRTSSDLLRRLYRPYALAAADGFARAGLVHPGEVQDYVARLKGYPGIVQARSLAGMIEPRAQSPGESWQRLRILDAGFPRPEAQFEVIDEFGNRYILDHAYPDLRIASEYDGREFHTDERHRAHDQGRREYLSATQGWRWVNADRSRIFGPDASYEIELGAVLYQPPLLPRRWGYGR